MGQRERQTRGKRAHIRIMQAKRFPGARLLPKFGGAELELVQFLKGKAPSGLLQRVRIVRKMQCA